MTGLNQGTAALSAAPLSVEIWRDIPGYEGSYQVSSLGRVRSLPRVIPVYDSVRQVSVPASRHGDHASERKSDG